ncbi:BnaA09g53010D [Brassica napus]|uniref:BnaA09g53010D protein n=1 Tax=Brassica napus TaxID=3708 RepID=A0A078JG52_BRANA|nr:BnaA09g53010D [Brassica napus]
MGQAKQAKNDSPLHEQCTTISSSNQNENFVEIEKEKTIALINAWEENEKAKAQTKAYKELCSIEAWENNMKTSLELDLKKMEVYYYIVSIHDEKQNHKNLCISI